jgi:phosphate transport system substrate-binding protein
MMASGLAMLGGATMLSACSGGTSYSGKITADGSASLTATVKLAATQFSAQNPETKIEVLESGTKVGFARLCNAEIDVAMASREPKAEETSACGAKGIEMVELQVANDGIGLIVNQASTLDCVDASDIRRAWDDKKLARWSELNPSLPNTPMVFFGLDKNSGTRSLFNDYFGGDDGKIRDDVMESVDVGDPVKKVAADPNGFGFTAGSALNDTVKTIKIRDDLGTCLGPTKESISAGRYPLSRPLYVYASTKAMKRSEIRAFVTSLVANSEGIAEKTNGVGLTAGQRQSTMAKLSNLS